MALPDDPPAKEAGALIKGRAPMPDDPAPAWEAGLLDFLVPMPDDAAIQMLRWVSMLGIRALVCPDLSIRGPKLTRDGNRFPEKDRG